jgi:hypothetical protein
MACTVAAMTTTHPTVKVGAITVAANDHTRHLNVIETPQELQPTEGIGMFVLQSYNGYRSFGLLTGRTTQRWGMVVPTIERYHVDTVVIDGAIWGVPGKRIAGTYVTRPENISQ